MPGESTTLPPDDKNPHGVHKYNEEFTYNIIQVTYCVCHTPRIIFYNVANLTQNVNSGQIGIWGSVGLFGFLVVYTINLLYIKLIICKPTIL